MKRYFLSSGVFLLALGLFGCGSPPPVVPDDGEDGPRLAERIDDSIQEWLTKPRAELAEMVKVKLESIRNQQEHARSNPDSVDLLPNLKPSISLPVFQQADYSDKAGLSLPPYATLGKKDADLALHLARHGDLEAAALFADPTDATLTRQLDEWRGLRNYPVEWAQLVALHQVFAQFQLANGDVDGASTLVQLHRQLREVLNPKTANGPLGAILLATGRRALAQAALAFRDPKVKKNRLAADIDAALKDWGEVPAPMPSVAMGTPRAELVRIFHSLEKGKILTALQREDRQRVLDLLAVPVTRESVDGVVVFLDNEDRLSEMLIFYYNSVSQYHPEPSHLVLPLTDAGIEGGPVSKPKGILRQTFVGRDFSYQVNILQAATSGSTAGGAIIRIGDPKGTLAAGSLPTNPRALGVVHLDRSFDQNRVALDPTAKPDQTVEITRPAAVAKVPQPIVDPRPVSVVLKREGEFNLLASLSIRWAPEENKHALATLLPPLWAAYGAGRMEGVEDERGGSLVFIWEDEQTRYTLRLPYVDVQPPELIVTDRRGSDALNARANQTALFETEGRKARFAANQPLERLPRWLYLPQVKLGMTRAEALAATPKREILHTLEIADGLNILIMAEPPKEATYWAKQIFLRFTPGADSRVAEIRVRYQEGPAAPTAQAPSLFDLLRKAPNGEPESLASNWASIWTDMPAKRFKPVLFRWLDDRTLMTYERDASGSEVTLRDCPLEQPLGPPLPPLEFCSRGLPNLTLRQDRAAVLQRWKIEKPEPAADGSVDLGEQPKDSRYDGVAVWFDNGKVSRIVARHRAKAGLQKEEIAAGLQEVWSENIDHLGIVRRIDTIGRGDSVLSQTFPSWGWHDDKTRVRCFGMDTEGGARLFTEWREWPIAGKPS